MYRITIPLVVIILLGCVAACSQDKPVVEADAMHFDSEFNSILPPLPAGREATEATASVIQGADAWDMSANAVVAVQDLELPSSPMESAWGIWELAPGSGVLSSAEVLLSSPAGDPYYTAVSNFTSGRWEFSGPHTESIPVSLSNADNLSSLGNCFVAVLTAGGNAVTIDNIIVNVERSGWQQVTVSTQFGTADTSMAIVDGHPAIAYLDSSGNPNKLKYIRSNTPTGVVSADWSPPVTIEYTDSVGFFLSMLVVDGNPAISHLNTSSFDLEYVRSTTSTGMNSADWSQYVVVDSTDTVGYYTSMAIVDGNPAISYQNVTDRDVKYARATSSDGALPADWTQIVSIDSGNEVGMFTSLEVVDGNPAISYFDSGVKSLKYVRSISTTGALSLDWGPIVTVDDSNETGQYGSLAIVDGNPAIAYYDISNFDLKYVRASNSTGTNPADWSQVVTVDSLGITGAHSTLAVIGGRPAICYIEPINDELRFIHSAGSGGDQAGDWLQIPTKVDNTPDFSDDISMVEVNGRPAISYVNASGRLTYAILYQ